MKDTPQLTSEQCEQLRNLKAHFPFRYCFAALHASTGEYRTYAVFNYPGRKMNKLAQQGFQLFELS